VIALFLVLVISLFVASAFLSGFIWSVKNDQFEDKEGSAMRILFDDELLTPPQKISTTIPVPTIPDQV